MGTDEGRKQEGAGVEGSSGKKEPGLSTGLDGTRSERGRWGGLDPVLPLCQNRKK